MRETWLRSLGRKDPLEEGTAMHSSILAWMPGKSTVLPAGKAAAPLHPLLRTTHRL